MHHNSAQTARLLCNSSSARSYGSIGVFPLGERRHNRLLPRSAQVLARKSHQNLFKRHRDRATGRARQRNQ